LARSFDDCLRSAGDVARRTQVQILALLASLLFVWFTGIEPQYTELSKPVGELATIEVAQTNLKRGIGLVRGRLGESLRNAQRIRNEFSNECNISKLGTRCESLSQQIGATTAKVRAYEIFINNRERLRTDQGQKISAIRQAIARQVNFDVGFGIKLPFSFSYASFIWLLLFGFILARAWIQRGKFWRLVTAAASRLESGASLQVEPHLVDMPVWLGPAPRTTILSVDRRILIKLVGWHDRSHQWFTWLLLATMGVAALRVAWIGLAVAGLAASHDIQCPFLGIGIAAATAANLLLLGGFALPWWSSARSDRSAYLRRERRLFLRGAVLIGAFAVTQIVTSGAFTLRWAAAKASAKRRARRHTPRRAKWSVVPGAALTPGWYRNRASGAVHYVWPGNRVRFGAGLKRSSLVREMALLPEPGRASLPAWVRTRDFHNVMLAEAKALATQGRYDPAIDLLLRAVRVAYREMGPSATLSLLDEAARLVVNNRTARLGELRQVGRDLAAGQWPIRSREALAQHSAKWERRSASSLGAAAGPTVGKL
jgi:hypothetical protein